jgi:surface antigen
MVVMAAISMFCFNPGYASNKNVLHTHTTTIGEDQVPCTISIITGYTDLISWVKNNYTDNDSMPVYYLPETIYTVELAGNSAMTFKTWEYNNYVQNILVERGKHLVLYTTPHGEYNPDGSEVFGKMLGFTLPVSRFTFLREDEHPSILGEATELTEFPPDFYESASSFGTYVGSYKGVNAYSNGYTSYFSNKLNSYSGYNTGYKWQCCEYVTRFFKAIFNREIRGGNANTYYSNASAKNLKRAPNGGTDKPQTGNILCSAGGSYGHVAIVREVGSNYIKVIQQNWDNSSSDNSKTLSMKVSNGKYTVSGFSSSYPVQGWLWPK